MFEGVGTKEMQNWTILGPLVFQEANNKIEEKERQEKRRKFLENLQ